MVKTNNNNALRDRRGDRNPLQLRILGGFTLAEVLITLGIIGVVAAMVIPSLISSFQKKIYYTKFMKARMVLENGLKLYQNETGCEDVFCGGLNTQDYVKEFAKHFNVATYITPDNYETVCKKYDKVYANYNGSDEQKLVEYICTPYSYACPNATVLGFITKDGISYTFCGDFVGIERVVDTNGPDNGPNTFGRDIFQFYGTADPIQERAANYCNNIWGMSNSCAKSKGLQQDGCSENWAINCGARLIEEGKMNY